MTPQKRRWVGPGEIFVLLVIGLIALIVITHNYRLIALRLSEMLYSGTSALLAVVMVVEYLLLKGSDRSDIYLRELELARQKRREDLLALREMETHLVELRAQLASPPGESGGPGDPAEAGAALARRLSEARQVVETVLRQLRERI